MGSCALFALGLVACAGPAGSPGSPGVDGADGAPAPDRLPPALVLGPRVYFVEGRAGSIYFENVTLAEDANSFAWDVTGVTVGLQLGDRWTWTPTASAATSLIVSTFDHWTATPLASAPTLVVAAPASAGAGKSTSCIFIGDSLTNAGAYTEALLQIAAADAMKLELRGTRGSGANRHEGRPGWKVASYTSAFADASGSNPFWNDAAEAVDFPGYLAANAIEAPDWVFIMLGTNDVFSQTDDASVVAFAEREFAQLDTLIASVRATGARVALLTSPPPTTSQDLFASNYGSGQTRWRFKRNILLWDRELLARYGDAQTSGVLVVPAHVAIDTAANMANGVHPSLPGYQQIAESIWAFLKSDVP